MISSVPHIARMSPYALAELKAPSGKSFISLAQNECLRPPSPLAIEAAAKELKTGQLYPDPDWGELRAALSAVHNISADRILCGCGSLELISCLTKAFADNNNAVLTSAHAYPFFRSAAQMVQARCDIAPEDDTCVSVDALLNAVRDDTRIVLVANPGNPTGTRIPRTELLRLREGLPRDVLLVIDEAYGEFADHLGERVFDLVDYSFTVVLRTFSKAYGLAGMRAGWGLFPSDIANEVRKVMNPNNVTRASQAAATAALADQDYMKQTCTKTSKLRDGFRQRLIEFGLDVRESFTNFVLIRIDSATEANRIDWALRTEGVLLRSQAGAGLGNCLRATVAKEDHLDIAAGFLEQLVKERRA